MAKTKSGRVIREEERRRREKRDRWLSRAERTHEKVSPILGGQDTGVRPAIPVENRDPVVVETDEPDLLRDMPGYEHVATRDGRRYYQRRPEGDSKASTQAKKGDGPPGDKGALEARPGQLAEARRMGQNVPKHQVQGMMRAGEAEGTLESLAAQTQGERQFILERARRGDQLQLRHIEQEIAETAAKRSNEELANVIRTQLDPDLMPTGETRKSARQILQLLDKWKQGNRAGVSPKTMYERMVAPLLKRTRQARQVERDKPEGIQERAERKQAEATIAKAERTIEENTPEYRRTEARKDLMQQWDDKVEAYWDLHDDIRKQEEAQVKGRRPNTVSDKAPLSPAEEARVEREVERRMGQRTHLPEPTDENREKWIQERLKALGLGPEPEQAPQREPGTAPQDIAGLKKRVVERLAQMDPVETDLFGQTFSPDWAMKSLSFITNHWKSAKPGSPEREFWQKLALRAIEFADTRIGLAKMEGDLGKMEAQVDPEQIYAAGRRLAERTQDRLEELSENRIGPPSWQRPASAWKRGIDRATDNYKDAPKGSLEREFWARELRYHVGRAAAALEYEAAKKRQNESND